MMTRRRILGKRICAFELDENTERVSKLENTVKVSRSAESKKAFIIQYFI
jgi:hypothetical protein